MSKLVIFTALACLAGAFHASSRAASLAEIEGAYADFNDASGAISLIESGLRDSHEGRTRSEWLRLQQDARTQFYIAYSYYRQGWGRLYNDDELFAQGLEAVDRAIAAAPGNRFETDDTNLAMRSTDELKVELQEGLQRDASDFNPLRVLRERK